MTLNIEFTLTHPLTFSAFSGMNSLDEQFDVTLISEGTAMGKKVN